MRETLNHKERQATIENISFPQAYDLAGRVVAVAETIQVASETLWDRLENHPDALANELLTTAYRSGRDEYLPALAHLISQHINIFIDTAGTVASFRSRFIDNPYEFFQQTFGRTLTHPDLLEIHYRPTGIYFIVEREDFNCLYTGKRKESVYGFVNSSDRFTLFPELRRKVSIAKKGVQRRIRVPTEESEISGEKGEYTIDEIIRHEERHLLYYQHIGCPADIKESTVEEAILNFGDLDRQRGLLADIRNSIVIGLVMEHAAYGGVNDKFSISPDAAGRTDWKDYFNYFRKALIKHHPPNAAQIRELWLEAYKDYLQEDKLIDEIARYMMEEVGILFQDRKETLSGLPKKVAEIVFSLMVPQAIDPLLQGLGFNSREGFLNCLKSIEISVIHKGGLFDGPHLFDIEPLDPNRPLSDLPTTIVTAEDLGLKGDDLNVEYIPPPAGPLGVYLDFLWNGGKDALVLDSNETENAARKGHIVKVIYDRVLYLGEPIYLDGSSIQLSDGSLFLNLHLPDVSSVSADDFQSVALFLKSLCRYLGRIAHFLESNEEIKTVIGASNAKLMRVLTNSFGFTQVDYLPEGKMAAEIRQKAYTHDKTLGQRIDNQPCPVAFISSDGFIARFKRYYYKQKSVIKI